MSELRTDPIAGHVVIVAENRAVRPDEFAHAGKSPGGARSDASATCPFCAGNEHLTPHSVAEYSIPTSDDAWQVRVVPNKYPAVDAGADTASTNRLDVQPPSGCKLAPGIGRHEVIVESPRHLLRLTDLDGDQIALVFRAYRDRLSTAAREDSLAYGLVFKNQGPAAGATLEHLHSQFLALPIIPLDVARELQLGLETLRRTGRCATCALVDQELASRKRIVAETPEFVVLCPFASRLPYETWIVPRAHEPRFDFCGDELSQRLAQIVREVLLRLESRLNRPDYNYLLRSAPFDTRTSDHYHWRMEILPRTTRLAGFEWGSGCFINPVAPERGAAELRSLAEAPTD